SIDPAVGVVVHKKVGDPVQAGEPLATIHYNSDARLHAARRLLEESYSIAPQPPASRRPLIHKIIQGTRHVEVGG
ncbi:MAG TPA: hypothetical protein VE734_05175, partial [Terriglobales bacterium]|nr:hypothetical protein [Terriglobales bacterium]